MIIWSIILSSVSYKWLLWTHFTSTCPKPRVQEVSLLLPLLSYTYVSTPRSLARHKRNQVIMFSKPPSSFWYISKSNARPANNFHVLACQDILLQLLWVHSLLLFFEYSLSHTDFLVVLESRLVLFQSLISLKLLLYVTTSEKSSLILLLKTTHFEQFILLIAGIFYHNTSSDVYHNSYIIHFTCLYTWSVVYRVIRKQNFV